MPANIIGPVRTGLTPQGRDTDSTGHKCSNCKTAYGVSAIPCKNHPRYNPLTGRLRPELGGTENG